eukprot:TRINITY_DN456_c0_g1_i21.p1 TRINITY_DN456_c0_g1~~TRINITY_DN456_c0_g1_i21.p1  ORF type:complete len:549 (-),score=10.22 TRINITY_DN456_c0_g1_i21:541-2187(-)
MSEGERRTVGQIRELIRQYNEEVSNSKQYSKRRLAKTTPTILYDSEFESVPPLRFSPCNWCKIKPDLAAMLETYRVDFPIISYRGEDQAALLDDQEFLNKCKAEMPRHLAHLAEAYLQMHYQLSSSYEGEAQTRVRARIESLTKELHESRDGFLSRPSVIAYIRKQLKEAKSGPRDNRPLSARKPSHGELAHKVLQMRSQREYSVRDICALCKISVATYYTICKRADHPQNYHVRPRGRPPGENSLTSYEIECIKRLADRPEKSYTVPDMCADIAEHLYHTVSRKMVYYHLTKKLGYSFKRNHFKMSAAVAPEQVIARYKVCLKLLEYFRQGKIVICMDETGFHLGVQREYSYCKKGSHPFRVKPGYSEKRNVMMAVTNEKVFAYNIRAKGHNEHSFIGFIIDITQRICQLGPDCVSNVVLFMDNAPFHTSALAKKLLSILPFPVLMNAVCSSDYNGCETVFSILKRRFKAKNCTKMQGFCMRECRREAVGVEVFNIAKSIESTVFLKCYIRTLHFIEQGIKEIAHFSQGKLVCTQPAGRFSLHESIV